MNKQFEEAAEKLLPCPFCGGNPEIKQTGKNKLKIRCKSCQIGVQQAVRVYSLEWLEERMIENWNRRELPSPPKD